MKENKIKLGGHEMYLITTGEAGSPAQDGSHARYAIKRSKELTKILAIFDEFTSRIGKVESVLELFGGSGFQSLYIQENNKPKRHVAIDIDSDCFKSIEKSLPKVTPVLGDAYLEILKHKDSSWEWIHADFNQFTYNRYVNDKKYKSIVDNIFRVSKRYVTITDSAIYGHTRFIQSKESYERLLGADPNDTTDYYRALSEKFSELYDFSVKDVITWNSNASMMLFEKGREPSPFDVTKAEDRRVSFEVVY